MIISWNIIFNELEKLQRLSSRKYNELSAFTYIFISVFLFFIFTDLSVNNGSSERYLHKYVFFLKKLQLHYTSYICAHSLTDSPQTFRLFRFCPVGCFSPSMLSFVVHFPLDALRWQSVPLPSAVSFFASSLFSKMITYAFGEGLYDDKACKDGTVHPKIKSVKDVVKEPFWLKGGRFIHSVGMLVLYVVFGLMVSANGPVSHTIVLNEAMRTVIIIWLGYMATAHVGMAHGFDLFCAGFLGDAQPPHDNTTLMLLNMCQNYFGMICVLCMMLLSLDKVPLAMMWVLIWMVCANLRADFYWLFGKSLGPRDEPQPRRLTFALSDLPLVLITLSILVHGVFTLEKTT